ncbi:MAG: hypothetical protein IT242_03670 [Bacteroidia bacterium]|nr:hypothetical protein [Bacteroidia bacterium]
MKNNKKRFHLQSRQRLRISRRKIIILSTVLVSILCLFLTSVLEFSNIDNSRAGQGKTVNVVVIEDQPFITDKEVAAPRIISRPRATENTVFIRMVKNISAPADSAIAQ